MSNLKVCVTGANGFIGSHLVSLLLNKGYQVVGAVRDTSQQHKTEHLRFLPNAKQQLHLVSIDLFTAYTLESAFDGCDAVFHLAAPTKLPDQVTDYKRELHSPTVDGTVNVLEACAQKGVKHVILTSSTAAVVGSEKPPGHAWTEDDWSDKENLTHRQAWYPLVKLLAEQAAWNFMKTRKPSFTLATVQPTMCIGPMLQPYLNASNELLLRYMNGTKQKIPRACVSFIDVRDCADAHLLIYESGSVGRHLVVGEAMTFDHVCSVLRRGVPAGKVPDQLSEGRQEVIAKYNTQKMKGLGLQHRSVVTSLTETITTFAQAGYINENGMPVSLAIVRQQQQEMSQTSNHKHNAKAAARKGNKAGVEPNKGQLTTGEANEDATAAVRPSYMSHDVSDVRVTEKELKDLFNTFDQDANGFISKGEFKRFYYHMDTMGLPEEEVKVDRMLAKYQMDNDLDRLTFDEFCIVMLKLAQR